MKPGDKVYYRYEIENRLLKKREAIPIKATILKESNGNEYDWVITFDDPLLGRVPE